MVTAVWEDARMGIRLEGSSVSCGGCGEVVYPDCRVIANHHFSRLRDGRVRWFSRDFGVVVHLCRSEEETEAIVSNVERLADRILANLALTPTRAD
jgi:hypothetical protein